VREVGSGVLDRYGLRRWMARAAADEHDPASASHRASVLHSGVGKLRVNSFTISLDGFGAGPNQSLDAPMGAGAQSLHRWSFATRTFQRMVLGKDDGQTGVDDDFAVRSFENLGAWIMGRNMFSPVRGPWADESWRGWWGDNPPYHVPVFVLTHHARRPLEMEGGTVFHFVTDGYESALEQAKAAAGARDIRIGGGVATIRQYLTAGLVDEMHIAISPVLLGRGEALFAGIDLPSLGFRVAKHVATEAATHVVLSRS
jgi:dihydrofolate reductase